MEEDLEIRLQALLAEAKEVANGFIALRDRAMKLEITFSDRPAWVKHSGGSSRKKKRKALLFCCAKPYATQKSRFCVGYKKASIASRSTNDAWPVAEKLVLPRLTLC